MLGGISVRVQDVAGVRKVLARMQRTAMYRARPVEPVMRYVAVQLDKEIDADFRAGGRPPFNWKRRADNTVAKDGPGPILGGVAGRVRRDIAVATVAETQPLNAKASVQVSGGQLAAWHHQGRVEPYTIAPRVGRFLCFLVADKGQLARRRPSRAEQRARRGGAVVFFKRVGPGGRVAPAGTVWMYATSVTRPTPAQARRRVVTVRQYFRRWRMVEPARRYFRGDAGWRMGS